MKGETTVSDTNQTSISRRQLLEAVGAAAAAAATIGVAGPATATDPASQELLPFTATVKGPLPAPAGMTPTNPPIAHFFQSFAGDSNVMGKITYADHHPAQLGLDGKLLGVTHGVGTLTATNGDAVYFTYSGAARQTQTGGYCNHFFLITGGTGRFAGAVGSGYLNAEGDSAKNEGTFTFDGMIALPKK
jgi:hypothetical protein